MRYAANATVNAMDAAPTVSVRESAGFCPSRRAFAFGKGRRHIMAVVERRRAVT